MPMMADFTSLVVSVYLVGLGLGILLSIQVMLQLWLIRLFNTPSVRLTYDWDDENDYWRTDHEDDVCKTPD